MGVGGTAAPDEGSPRSKPQSSSDANSASSVTFGDSFPHGGLNLVMQVLLPGVVDGEGDGDGCALAKVEAMSNLPPSVPTISSTTASPMPEPRTEFFALNISS